MKKIFLFIFLIILLTYPVISTICDTQYGKNWSDSDNDGIFEVNETLNFTGAYGDGVIPFDFWQWDFYLPLDYIDTERFEQHIYNTTGNYTVTLREGSIEFDIACECIIYVEVLNSNDIPKFIKNIPDFIIYNDEDITFSDMFNDDNIQNIIINSSCDFLNIMINNTENKFYIWYDPDYSNINHTYCNISLIYIGGYNGGGTIYSNNFIVDINDRLYSYSFLDLREKNHIMLLGFLAFIYIVFLCYSILYKNIILKSFAVILGFIIGIILFQIHWILFLMFILKNITIWLFT